LAFWGTQERGKESKLKVLSYKTGKNLERTKETELAGRRSRDRLVSQRAMDYYAQGREKVGLVEERS